MSAPLLTICMLSFDKHLATYFTRSFLALCEQVGDDPRVEVLAFLDNSRISLGRKRHSLFTLARGSFITTIDDDDEASPHYVGYLLDAIGRYPDVDAITFDLDYSEDQRHKVDIQERHIPEDDRSSDPWQVRISTKSAISSRIAKSLQSVDRWAFEDVIYSDQLYSLIHTEHHINQTLYYVRYDSYKSYGWDWRVAKEKTMEQGDRP